MQENIKKALKEEKKLAAMMDRLKEDIVRQVREAPALEGVRQMPGPGLNCAVVRRSAISRSPNLQLSPEFYLQGAQARLVQAAIAPCKTVSALMERVDELASAKKTRVGALNENTVRVLSSFC